MAPSNVSTFPPPPVNTIDWNNVGFKVREVNGHVASTYSYSTTKAWSTPEFVASPFLSIHGMAPGLNYGVQAYEGMKAFRTPSGSISVFRPDQNAKRMAHSADFISVPSVPEEHFLKCVEMAVALNAEYVPPHETGAAMYVRPLLFGSSAQLGLNPPDEYTFVVFVMPTGVYHGVHAVDALILEEFDRAAPDGTGSAKIGGNYAPVLRWSERARNEGFGITLHLDSKTRSEIDEFSTSGFVGVKKDGDQVTVVVPDSKNVIKSVTSESVCEIGRRMLGYKIEKRRIAYEELGSFSEVMAAGTAASLVPIKSITMKSKDQKIGYGDGSDEPGDVCLKLLTTLKDIQMGKIKDQFGWCLNVTAPAEEIAKQVNGVDGKVVNELP